MGWGNHAHMCRHTYAHVHTQVNAHFIWSSYHITKAFLGGRGGGSL